METFAKLLADLRGKTGLTKYALARKAGVTHQAISHLEGGKREPSWTMIRQLRLALGCRFEDLDDGSVTIPNETTKPRGRPPKKPRTRKGK